MARLMHAQSLLPPTLRGGMLRLPTWSLRVYTPPTTLISTTKKLDSVGPPPLGTTGRRSGRGACHPPGLPRVLGRELSAVGAAEGKVAGGRVGERAGPAGAGQSVYLRTGVAPKGRTATPPPAAI